MKLKTCTRILVSLFLAAATGLTMAKDEPPEITVDGLHLQKDAKLALVYVQPGANLKQYERIYLVDAFVSFRKNWRRDQSRSVTGRISTNRVR